MKTNMSVIITLIVATIVTHMSAVASETLHQNLGDGDHLLITDPGFNFPEILVQNTPRRSQYHDDLLDIGFHIRTGTEVVLPSDIRMHNLNTCHVIGAQGGGTVVRYTGRWQADGGNAFPHLILTEGARFIFTSESSMNGVLEGSFFVRQLWVYGDGTGIIELEENFTADHTRNEPIEDALGTIRLGGATLITHHTRNMPANTRPDGRGGHYQNGHVVFERVNGNRWIVDSNNQVYGAQIDFDTDGVIETRAALTHNGHLRVVLPVGPGGHFISSGAFRTTSTNVTITKTGPAMLALEGEQSYHSGSRLIVEEGLLRMTTDPGLGRDTTVRGNPGPYLDMHINNSAHAHFSAPLHRMRKLTAVDNARVWLDRNCVIDAAEVVVIGDEARFDMHGAVQNSLQVNGRLALDQSRGNAAAGSLQMNGTLSIDICRGTSDIPVLKVENEAALNGRLTIGFTDHRGRVPEQAVLVAAGSLSLGGSITPGTYTCRNERFSYNLAQDGNLLIISGIEAIQ